MPRRTASSSLFPLVAFVLAVVSAWAVFGENTPMFVSGQYVASQGGSTNNPCPGPYKGYARMTNSTGIWFRPPTNATTGVFTNTADFSNPPVLQAVRRGDLMCWCGTNSVTFPASSSNQYQLGAYLKTNVPPPTNGQIVTLSIEWQ